MTDTATTERVHLVQLLCGPKRHAIFALGYLPGMSAQGSDDRDVVLTPDNVVEFMQGIVDGILKRGLQNPWCAVCGAVADQTWFYQEGVTEFATMEAAEPHLYDCQREQLQTRALFGDIGQRRN